MSERKRTQLFRIVITSDRPAENTSSDERQAAPIRATPQRPYVEAGSVRFQPEPEPEPAPAVGSPPRGRTVLIIWAAIVVLLVLIVLVVGGVI